MTLDLDQVRKTHEYIKVLAENKLNLSKSLELIGQINTELYEQQGKLEVIYKSNITRYEQAQEKLDKEKKNNDGKYEQAQEKLDKEKKNNDGKYKQEQEKLELIKQSNPELYKQGQAKLDKERENNDKRYAQQKKQRAPEPINLNLSTNNAFEAIKAGIVQQVKDPNELAARIAELHVAKHNNENKFNTEAQESLHLIINSLKDEYKKAARQNWEDSESGIAAQRAIQEKIALASKQQEQDLSNNVEKDDNLEASYSAVYIGSSGTTKGKGLFNKNPEQLAMSKPEPIMGSEECAEQGNFDLDDEDNLAMVDQEQLANDLHSAIYDSDAQRVTDLLARGADPSYQNEQGNDALHIALDTQNIEIVEEIFKIYSDIKARNTDGDSHLHLAVRYGFSNIALQLITKGADLDDPNKEGDTPLSEAVLRGNTALFDELINVGAKITILDIDLNSLLHLTSTTLVTKLVGMGLPIDHPNVKGATPLNWTIITHNVEKAHLLLQEGADVNYISIPRDLDGEPLQCYTPLQSLVERSPRPPLSNNEKNVEMAKLLIAYGAETRAKVWCQAERKIISCDLMTDITDRDVVEAIEKSEIIRDVLVAKNLEVNQNQDIRELFYKIIDASIDKVEVTGKQLTSDSLTFVNDITTQYLAVQQSEQIDAPGNELFTAAQAVCKALESLVNVACDDSTQEQVKKYEESAPNVTQLFTEDVNNTTEQQPSRGLSGQEEEGAQLAALDLLVKGAQHCDTGHNSDTPDYSASSEPGQQDSLTGESSPWSP